ncbi:hypothetical protein GIB67_000992 [Kingdonia uniflora]|uniref:Association with the SNF1 complex (ASC) domain-containing protein n=1 Tax=Kingdonia uniflora TaxID=39325 RepID=A0A7J7MFR5_9MAGN|nr:hypothetical protein GIB67_000992 [Kingdonia uniflora]
MGNVSSVRGDGGSNNSGEFEEEQHMVMEEEENHESSSEEHVRYQEYYENEMLPDLNMAHDPQSPPHIPTAAYQSPFMFVPQVPMVPLQKANERPNFNQAWIENSTVYEDMGYEQGIPTMITWCYGGREVAVVGSWDDWKSRRRMQKSGKEFTLMKVLPSGVYQYKFFVDQQWRYSPDLPVAQDETGSIFNVLDLQDYTPEHLENLAIFEPPQSPDSSYNNGDLGPDFFEKEPPFLPSQLNTTLLNAPSSSTDNNGSLPRPPHVVLNHLYMQRRRPGQSVVALGSTHRYLNKYVTVVLYKNLQR